MIIKKKIGVFSTSRSDFGILSPLIEEIKKNNFFKLFLFAGGDHFLYENSLKNLNANLKVDSSFDYISKNSFFDYKEFSKSTSIINIKLQKIFKNYNFDYTLILGDRHELIPIIHHSIILNKKIIHIGGGEITEGAIDNKIRYMISSIADYQFTMHNNYKNNLIENKLINQKIYNVGYLGVDNIKKINFIKKKDIFRKYKIDTQKKLAMFTYHPSICEINIKTIRVLKSILRFTLAQNYQIIVSFPGVELKNYKIKNLILDFKNTKDLFIFPNLGFKDYNNLLKYSDFVFGNSSSGIIEAPFYKIPSINIGDRQQGRIRHISVLDCDLNLENFKEKLQILKKNAFKTQLKKMNYKFGKGKTAKKIIKYLLN
jgi:GDP/UDP-N,N'-diacetylbacillosamine 2-epimerase (hydrolysing)